MARCWRTRSSSRASAIWSGRRRRRRACRTSARASVLAAAWPRLAPAARPMPGKCCRVALLRRSRRARPARRGVVQRARAGGRRARPLHTGDMSIPSPMAAITDSTWSDGARAAWRDVQPHTDHRRPLHRRRPRERRPGRRRLHRGLVPALPHDGARSSAQLAAERARPALRVDRRRRQPRDRRAPRHALDADLHGLPRRRRRSCTLVGARPKARLARELVERPGRASRCSWSSRPAG